MEKNSYYVDILKWKRLIIKIQVCSVPFSMIGDRFVGYSLLDKRLNYTLAGTLICFYNLRY